MHHGGRGFPSERDTEFACEPPDLLNEGHPVIRHFILIAEEARPDLGAGLGGDDFEKITQFALHLW